MLFKYSDVSKQSTADQIISHTLTFCQIDSFLDPISSYIYYSMNF